MKTGITLFSTASYFFTYFQILDMKSLYVDHKDWYKGIVKGLGLNIQGGHQKVAWINLEIF